MESRNLTLAKIEQLNMHKSILDIIMKMNYTDNKDLEIK
jgi:hypothetical protein